MSKDSLEKFRDTQGTNPWFVWTGFFSALLVFISLWFVSMPSWHLGISGFTIITLWKVSKTPLRTLGSILGLVTFLAFMQITFSSFMREMFLESLEEGFHWAEWQYLLFAVERFAWPLVMVSAFQSKLTSPSYISQLTQLFLPLKWLGLKIEKLQVLILLSLRFIPALKLEWQRFSHFQNYFMGEQKPAKLMQKLRYGQGVLKAMIAHTIYGAVRTGDMLALRGLPYIASHSKQKLWGPLIPWLSIGALFYFLDSQVFYIWLGLSTWLALVPLARDSRAER